MRDLEIVDEKNKREETSKSCKKRNFSLHIFSAACFHFILITFVFVVLGSFFVFTGICPSHDSIEWHGIFHYFYTSLEKGIIPYWNPYSQTGTPFFVYYQPLGLLEISNFFFILVQKLTGCNSLTAYVLHYLFYYYIFIIGTYSLLRIITNSNNISLLFSIILFLASFPNFMVQNGALNPFFLIPFITFFALLFFESDMKKKGFYFFIISFLCSLTMLIYIPSGLIFYLFLFLILSFLLKIAHIKEIFQFVKSKYGVVWISLSFLIIILVCLNIFTLYYELHWDNELFPTIRVFLMNDINIPDCYASDIKGDVMEEGFTDNKKTSLTIANLMGIIFEPFLRFFQFFSESSELKFYMGILPLLCIFIAIKKYNNKYTWLFTITGIFMLFTTCNFKSNVKIVPSIFQVIIGYICPPMKMFEVMQNFVTLFLFCFVIVGAIGFKVLLEQKNKFPWLLSLIILSLKYIILLLAARFLFIDYLGIYRPIACLQTIPAKIFIPFLLGVMLFLAFFLMIINKLSLEKVKWLTLCVMFLELFFFNFFYIYQSGVVSREYYKFLLEENIIQRGDMRTFLNYKDAFQNYRVPLSLPEKTETEYKDTFFFTFFGHEIYSVNKTAFPSVIKFIQLRQYHRKDYVICLWDHFYMTEYYYDYIVNIDYEKQPATSNIIFPILNFFPEKNVIFLKDKYEVSRVINKTSIEDLGKYIFIEKNKFKKSSLDTSYLFDPKNFLSYSLEKIHGFEDNQALKYPDMGVANIKVKNYDINSLSVIVETPEDGYFYFGDGYSKHWKAFVDKREVKIEKTNINFKSVYLSRGKHEIDFIYDPVIFRYSLYANFAGYILFFIILIIYFFTDQYYHKKV